MKLALLYPLTDKGAEAQSREETCPRSPGLSVIGWDRNWILLTAKPQAVLSCFALLALALLASLDRRGH